MRKYIEPIVEVLSVIAALWLIFSLGSPIVNTIIIFILILGLLVFVHELGHFLVAKKTGMQVEEFGFGFPPRMFGIKKGETTYSINWIPFGGFVKIYGEDGLAAGQAGEHRDAPRSFASKPIGTRLKV